MSNLNEIAFPVAASWADDNPQILVRQGGLTKLEYFTAAAMQGILAANKKVEYGDNGRLRDMWSDEIARESFFIAMSTLKYLDSELNPSNQK